MAGGAASSGRECDGDQGDREQLASCHGVLSSWNGPSGSTTARARRPVLFGSVVDAALTYALTLVGVPLAPVLLGAFAFRLFNFWLPVIPALAVLRTVRRIGNSAPAAS
jgi:hypothetical protein